MDDRMERQKEAKKANLLEAAQALFLQKGFSKTSISEIAQRASVAKGTFYLYFKDKDDVMQKLVYQISYSLLGQAFAYTEAHHKEQFEENVVTFVDWLIQYFIGHPEILRLIRRDFSWPIIEQGLSDHSDDPLWNKLFARILAAPIAAGRSQKQLFYLIFMIVEMCGSVCYSSIIEQRPDTIENVQPMMYDMIRRMLA